MYGVVLFCKSYREDVYRARRLAETVARFNTDVIPLFFSVPASDLSLFQTVLHGISCNFVEDEQILQQTHHVYGNPPHSFPDHLFQQLVKLEFWRMRLCKTYVWLDSDSYFIRRFTKKDFFADENTPYTIQHDTRELRQYSDQHDPIIMQDFLEMARHFRGLFRRKGPAYNFGYPPIIWSCRVLESLYEDYLKQRGSTIFDLLKRYPCEMQLYGEYLLYSNVIPLVPIQPLFKVFHYAGQFFESQTKGEYETSLAKDYLGIIIQSNWARIDKKKSLSVRFSQGLRRLRRFTKQLTRR